MNHSPAAVLRVCLVAGGAGSWPTDKKPWPIYVGSFLDQDGANLICLYNIRGRMDGRYMRTVNEVVAGQRVTHPGWQLLVRGKDEEAAWSRMSQLCTFMDQNISRTKVEVVDAVGGFAYYRLQAVTRLTDPVGIGETPERRREVLTVTGILTVDPILVTSSC